MKSLVQELRRTIADHVQIASAADIVAITSTLCGVDGQSNGALGISAVRELPRFEVSGGVVTDTHTGLMWSRAAISGGKRNWAESLKAASALTLGGYSDWRAPTIAERLAINDYTRSEPALDPAFMSEKSGWEWTSTPYAPSPGDYAWFVGFGYGDSYYGYQGDVGFVRAVRVGQLIGTLG